jgi:hypothetical protein
MRPDDPWARGTREGADERELEQMFEKQIDDIHTRADFARIRRRQWMATGVALVAMLLFIVADPKYERTTLPLDLPRERVSGFAFGLILSSVLYSLWNWRCPACGKSLGRSLFPRFCAKCGAKLV